MEESDELAAEILGSALRNESASCTKKMRDAGIVTNQYIFSMAPCSTHQESKLISTIEWSLFGEDRIYFVAL